MLRLPVIIYMLRFTVICLRLLFNQPRENITVQSVCAGPRWKAVSYWVGLPWIKIFHYYYIIIISLITNVLHSFSKMSVLTISVTVHTVIVACYYCLYNLLSSHTYSVFFPSIFSYILPFTFHVSILPTVT
jgi:hypothetical protein